MKHLEVCTYVHPHNTKKEELMSRLDIWQANYDNLLPEDFEWQTQEFEDDIEEEPSDDTGTEEEDA